MIEDAEVNVAGGMSDRFPSEGKRTEVGVLFIPRACNLCISEKPQSSGFRLEGSNSLSFSIESALLL